MTSAPASRTRAPFPLWLAVLAAAASGLLMSLAYPSVGAWGLVFPAVALLLVALIGRRAGGAFLVGLVYGAVFFAILVFWTTRYLGPIPWAALFVLEAILTAVALIPVSLAYRWLPRVLPGRVARLLLLPALIGALWIARDVFVGSWPYGGFPWSRIGMTQSESPLAPLSSWIGVGGLGFVMVAAVAVLIEIVRTTSWRRPLWLALPALLIVVLFATPLFPTSAAGTMRIGAVQGNGPTAYFDTREPYSVIGAQMAATEPLYGEDLDLLVWPEGSLDADPEKDATTARMLTRISNRVGAPVLANVAAGEDDEYFNTSLLWEQDGTVAQTHAKRHPVPFGEYVPDRAFFNALAPDLISLLQREYTPGTDAPLIDVNGTKLGLAICFDVIYDDLVFEGIEGGAQALLFQTNNADFRGTVENLQQLAFARMRAIETGRSVVNISTVGTSQIIRADGSTLVSLDADEAGAMVEDVELRTGITAGVIVGPWLQGIFLWGSLGALVLLFLSQRLRRPRTSVTAAP